MEDQQDFNHTDKTVTIFDPNPGSSQATVKNDGYNTTITLEAAATSDIDTVRFQFSTDAGATYTNIGGASGFAQRRRRMDHRVEPHCRQRIGVARGWSPGPGGRSRHP